MVKAVQFCRGPVCQQWTKFCIQCPFINIKHFGLVQECKSSSSLTNQVGCKCIFSSDSCFNEFFIILFILVKLSRKIIFNNII